MHSNNNNSINNRNCSYNNNNKEHQQQQSEHFEAICFTSLTTNNQAVFISAPQSMLPTAPCFAHPSLSPLFTPCTPRQGLLNLWHLVYLLFALWSAQLVSRRRVSSSSYRCSSPPQSLRDIELCARDSCAAPQGAATRPRAGTTACQLLPNDKPQHPISMLTMDA